MFFGLCNSPSTFQTFMDHIFQQLPHRHCVIVYMDDILIFTESLEEHRIVVKEVLQALEENKLGVKPDKCEFEKKEMEFLGFIIDLPIVLYRLKIRCLFLDKKEWGCDF